MTIVLDVYVFSKISYTYLFTLCVQALKLCCLVMHIKIFWLAHMYNVWQHSVTNVFDVPNVHVAAQLEEFFP